MWLRKLIGWVLAGIFLAIRATCRVRFVGDDPRVALRDTGESYVIAILHAHQLSILVVSDEPKIVAMVSRSTDGELLIPSLKARHVVPLRGSTRKAGKDKGRREALQACIEHVRNGYVALIAVDGPRGPRNTVHRGAPQIALETHQPIIPAVAVPTRRFILKKTWDRFQIPAPFSTVVASVGQPIYPDEGESTEGLRQRVQDALRSLETKSDGPEAQLSAERDVRDAP